MTRPAAGRGGAATGCRRGGWRAEAQGLAGAIQDTHEHWGERWNAWKRHTGAPRSCPSGAAACGTPRSAPAAARANTTIMTAWRTRQPCQALGRAAASHMELMCWPFPLAGPTPLRVVLPHGVDAASEHRRLQGLLASQRGGLGRQDTLLRWQRRLGVNTPPDYRSCQLRSIRRPTASALPPDRSPPIRLPLHRQPPARRPATLATVVGAQQWCAYFPGLTGQLTAHPYFPACRRTGHVAT